MYQPRTYRATVNSHDLVAFNVMVKESDLYVRATTNLAKETRQAVLKYRRTLEDYITTHPYFLTSLVPLPADAGAPKIVKAMLWASEKAGVGPMASVAGAIAQFVAGDLPQAKEIIIENGGDIYIRSTRKRVISIFAGNSPLSGLLGLEILGRETPLGICTSSGTVGHSLSYGQADAAIAISPDAALADAAATAIGNVIKTPDDIKDAIALAQRIEGLKGLVVIKDDSLGIWGEVKLIKTTIPGNGRRKTRASESSQDNHQDRQKE
ncbi:MAG: UPF0280 family protein [Dehalococcoidales bacterium]|jgi:hypothetical protein